MGSRQESSPQTPPESAAVVVPRAGPKVPALYDSADVPMTQWGTNYDVTTPAGWASVLAALQPADWIPSDGGEFWLNVVAWVCHPHEVTDRNTGEVKVVTRLVLIGADGKTAALCNEFSPRNFTAAILSYPGTWPKGGMPTRFFSEKSRKQGQSDYGTFQFRPDLIKWEDEE